MNKIPKPCNECQYVDDSGTLCVHEPIGMYGNPICPYFKEKEKVYKMKVTKLESFPAGENVFKIDVSNMGVQLGVIEGEKGIIGGRIFAMMSNFPSEVMDWVVIVNEFTGERIRIDFVDDEHPESERGVILNTFVEEKELAEKQELVRTESGKEE